MKILYRCELIKQYVNEGGAFCMIGGYMSFSGIDARARYGQTAVADVLPVKVLSIDDREERPEGIIPEITHKGHEIFKGIDGEWPFFLGYNKTVESKQGKVLATINGEPLIAVGEYGKENQLYLHLIVHRTGDQKIL